MKNLRAMPNFRSFDDLFKYLNKEIKDVQKKEIAQKAVETMQSHVQKDVYDIYPDPKVYERTGDLKKDIQIEITNDSNLILSNETYHNGKYIPEIIESGKGYTYSGYGYAYEQPRPFVSETYKDFVKNGLLHDAMRKGLKNKGLNVK